MALLSRRHSFCVLLEHSSFQTYCCPGQWHKAEPSWLPRIEDDSEKPPKHLGICEWQSLSVPRGYLLLVSAGEGLVINFYICYYHAFRQQPKLPSGFDLSKCFKQYRFFSCVKGTDPETVKRAAWRWAAIPAGSPQSPLLHLPSI